MIPKTLFSKTPWWAFVLDLVLVTAFVLIGRRTHDETDAVTGILTTWWPFLSGLIIGWLSLIGVRWPFVTIWSGAVVVVATVFVGMLLRVSSGQGVALSFVIVATVVLAVFLIGWRFLAILLVKRRAARAA